MRRDCSGLVLSNVQPASAVPFLAAARRLRLPVVAHVASWDHTVGKGVISPHCDLYVVQNRVMEDDLRRYHGIEPERVRVTGWPQTDLFHRRRPRAEYEELLRGYGLDPRRPLVLVAGNTPSNAPYEGRFVERLVAWWEQDARQRLQLLFRPHPRDREWRERFAAATGRDGVVVQEASYTDLDDLAALLQHGDVVVCNAGTILLDALVGDRPAVCVLYDEGAPPGESWAAKNVVGKHYEELAASGAFYRAESFDEVVAGIERALERPDELERQRRRAVEQVVGDGRRARRPSASWTRFSRSRPLADPTERDLVVIEEDLVLRRDEQAERIDCRPGPEERIRADFGPPVVVEHDDTARRQQVPRERCIDEDVEAQVRAVDVHEIELRAVCREVEQAPLRVADELRYP